MVVQDRIRTVAIVGAGAAGNTHTPASYLMLVLTVHTGAVTAAAFAAEKYFERIRVFERRESAGGTWYFCIYNLSLP